MDNASLFALIINRLSSRCCWLWPLGNAVSHLLQADNNSELSSNPTPGKSLPNVRKVELTLFFDRVTFNFYQGR